MPEGETVWATAVLASAICPLASAWRANAGTTLRPTILWAAGAWLAWLTYAFRSDVLTAYAALTFSAAMFVAVLGARRPGVVAWNFVVLGFLIVAWLGWAEGTLTGGGLKLGPLRLGAVAIVLLVGLGNYFATWAFPGVLSFAIAAGLTFEHLRSGQAPIDVNVAGTLAGAAPWLAWVGLRAGRAPASMFGGDWQRFRDRFGAIWALRLAEQFNRAAANAGWPVRLGWMGLEPPTTQPATEWHDTLMALQRRFRARDRDDSPA